jgi:hypothetical protein
MQNLSRCPKIPEAPNFNLADCLAFENRIQSSPYDFNFRKFRHADFIPKKEQKEKPAGEQPAL